MERDGGAARAGMDAPYVIPAKVGASADGTSIHRMLEGTYFRSDHQFRL